MAESVPSCPTVSAAEPPPGDRANAAAAAIAELRARFEEFDWYHTQELAPGIVTPGMFDLRGYVDHYGIPQDLSGMRVLEVGTFEGFWAFELERRGADVTAIDIDRIQQLDWPPRLRPSEDRQRGGAFALLAQARGSSVKRVGMSIYDANPEALGGRFDLVFCGSVLIHLRDPMLALERMAELCRGELILCEEYAKSFGLFRRPGGGAEFRGESPWSVWWVPTTRTWEAMVRCAGFESVRRHRTFKMRFRAAPGGVPHVVVHAAAAAKPGSIEPAE